jgi:hypothetical protein
MAGAEAREGPDQQGGQQGEKEEDARDHELDA